MKAKLPRKQKKQFIKKYGREDYYEACWLSRFSSNVDSAIGIRGHSRSRGFREIELREKYPVMYEDIW